MKRNISLLRAISMRLASPVGCFFLACFLWPSLGFAEDLMGGISENDFSIRFLSNIFGVVDGVLHGSGSQIFGAMFGVFNSAVLTLGTTILGYTLFVSTLRTAHEGEALGRNWSSMWIPLKSAAGFALMLPKATGYSMIQIFVMWVVVQGVGAANLIWNAALDYLNSGGAIVQPQTPSLKGSVGLGGDVLRAEICMFMIEQTLTDEQQKKNELDGGTPSTPIPSFLDSVTNPTPQNQPAYKGATPTITFPGTLTNPDGSNFANGQYDGICGKVTWTSSKNPGAQQLSDARGLATLQVITDLAPYAQQIAKDYGPFPDAKQSSLNTMSQYILVNAGNDYEGIVGPAVNLLQSFRTGLGLTSFIQEAKDEGWIMAGSYYQQLVTLNRNYATDETSYPKVEFNFPPSKIDNLPVAMKALSIPPNGSLAKFFSKEASSSVLAQYIDKQVNAAATSSGDVNKWVIPGYDAGSGIAGQILSVFTLGLSGVIQGFAELWNNKGLSSAGGMSLINPVTSAAVLGSGLITFVGTVWIIGAAVVLSVSGIAGICPAANPLGMAINSFMVWLMPLLSALMVLMFVLGATLSYYIPMVPYILFLFGGIGWLIGVIESIAAAPLVALGIAYPEGRHEILGQAEPAMMLLAGIFIRPSLMVIGFIAGISLSYVGIWILNAGFTRAAIAMTAGAQGFAWLFMPIALMSIYTALVVQIINQSFGLIHAIPDEVLRWVGGGGKQFGESSGEQAVARAFKDDMSSLGKGMADSTSKSVEMEQQRQKEGAGGRPGGGGGDGPGISPGGGAPIA